MIGEFLSSDGHLRFYFVKDKFIYAFLFITDIMKTNLIILLLLSILLVSPLVLAQEQAQTEEQIKIYSGFDRFIDNVKMFFSFGDKKVMLALDIREKELNSAIINTKNGEFKEAEKNLERAKENLQFVQNKISKDIAEDVKTNIDKTIDKINGEKNLPDDFKTYVLQEEKTQLTAELLIEIEGKEGGALTRDLVKDGKSGKNNIETIVNDDGSATIDAGVMEIEEKIADIVDNQFKEITVQNNTVEIGEIEVSVGVDPNATPKTPAPNDGSICCKKIINGKPQYHWDYEEVCLNPESVKGKVVYNDFCLALGTAIDKEDDIITEGVPEECAKQGAYDKESCGEIMKKLPVCCKHHIGGEIEYEIKYEWTPGDICVSPDRERVDDDFCLA